MRTNRPSSPSLLFAAVLACTSSAVAQASWQLTYPAQSPPANQFWAAAFDEVRGEAIIAFPDGAPQNQGWRWNGSTWTQLPSMPPIRIKANLVWHAARQSVVLFGGDWGGYLTDTWEWTGSAWQQLPIAGPPGRRDQACAYDRARNVIVMFGGNNGNQLNDTWEFQGQTWTQVNPTVRPAIREQAAMAFDPNLQVMVLYGGFGAPIGRFSDTWTWNGSVWQQRFPITPPFYRDRPAMVTDLDRSRIVLFGGSNADYQTWEWNGAQWHASTPNSPGPRSAMCGAYDTVRREFLLHGGSDYYTGGPVNQTWIYRTNSPATSTSFGAGCGGSAGAAVLASAPYTLPWLGDTMRTRVTSAPTSLGALFVSSLTAATPTDLTPFGMPGCNLLVAPDSVEFRTANAGTTEWTLVLPNNTALVGIPIYQQAMPLDSTANALGLAASNGLVMVPGIR